MSRPIQLTHCTLHLERNEVEGPDGAQRLTATESDLLSYMVAHAGRTISKEELLRNVWHYAPGVQSRAPDHTINRLRTKIEANPRKPDHLETVYGVGYRLDLTEDESATDGIIPTLAALPVPAKPLRGRDEETKAIEALLESGARWITVIGPGGMGKTHLARAVGAGKAALWCDLRSANTASEAASVVGQALGVQSDLDVGAGAPRIVQGLNAVAPELVVLDNMEQLDRAATALMAGWLDAVPALRILATSRVPLRLDPEHVVRLGALVPEVAETLFRERAQAVTGVSQDWGAAVLDPLLSQLGGMPLAIELAAGRMGVLGPAELGQRLAEDVGVLAGGREPHHQTVRHTLERSWTLLTALEQSALAQCTVFRRSFDVSAVEAVVGLPDGADPVLSVLSQLVDASMLRRVEGSETRFDFFVMTRAFVEEMDVDLGGAVARHMAHFHAQALEAHAQRRSPRVLELRARLVDQIPDMLCAAEVAQSIDSHAFTEILVGLDPVIGRELPVDRIEALVEAAVALSQGLGALSDLCHALGLRGRVHFLSGRWDASWADLEQAIELALGDGRDGLAAKLEVQMSSQLIPRGELELAEQMAVRGVAHARKAELPWILGRGLFQIARCTLTAHREDESRSHLLQALPIQREVGDWVGVSRTTAALGRLESNIGRMAQAELHFRDALETYRDQPVPGHLSWVICCRSEVYCRWGRLDKAESLARDAISLTNVRGTPGERAVAEFNMGMVMLESGKLEAAHAHIDKARRSVDQLGFRRFLGDVLMGLGCVYFDGGDLVMAEATWDQAMPVYEETANRKAAGFVEGMRGMVALVRGDLGQAVERLEGVIDLEMLEPRSRLLFQFSLAIVYADQGQDSSAHEQLEAALKMDPGNQIDVAAIRSLAERLDAWLASGRPPEAMDGLVQQIADCRAPAGADLCAAAGCSTDLRWLIAALEQHLIGAQDG